MLIWDMIICIHCCPLPLWMQEIWRHLATDYPATALAESAPWSVPTPASQDGASSVFPASGDSGASLAPPTDCVTPPSEQPICTLVPATPTGLAPAPHQHGTRLQHNIRKPSNTLILQSEFTISDENFQNFLDFGGVQKIYVSEIGISNIKYINFCFKKY